MAANDSATFSLPQGAVRSKMNFGGTLLPPLTPPHKGEGDIGHVASLVPKFSTEKGSGSVFPCPWGRGRGGVSSDAVACLKGEKTEREGT